MTSDFSLQETLSSRGWLFTSHRKDLSGALGHGKETPGLSLEQVRGRLSQEYPVIGAKTGVKVSEGRYSLVVDADYTGVFEWLQVNYPETFGKTLTCIGSKPGHFYFETDSAVDSTAINTTNNCSERAIDILGIGRMAVMPPSPHRKTEQPYYIHRDAEPRFVPWSALKASLLHMSSEKGFSWSDLEKTQYDNPQRNSIAEKIKEKLTLFDLDSSLKPGLQSCTLSGHKHRDKHPSLSISQDGKLFNCFSSHGGGDVFTWLMLRENLTFKEVLIKLAEKAGIKLSKTAKTRDGDEETTIVVKSFYEHDGTLYEEIFDGKSVGFAVWRDGGYKGKVKSIEIPGVTVVPITGDTLTSGLVSLPSEPLEYGDEVSLLTELKAFIHCYADVSKDYEEIAANYVMLTWVYDRFSTLPYLRVLGDPGCGKSRFESVMAAICYKGMKVSGAVTPAPIYRLLDLWAGTLIIDEADFRQSDEKSEVVTILNCGFEKNSPVIRCNKENPDQIQVFPSFGPKIIATRRTFKDKALESRCLTEVMQQTRRKDLPFILPQRFYEEAEQLRNKLLMFRFRRLKLIDPDSALAVDLGDVDLRIKQATASFAVLFTSLPELCEMFRVFLKNYNEALIEERSETLEGEVVAALCDIVGDGILNITSKMISEKIGGDTTPRKVAAVLKSLGFKTKQERRVIEEGGKSVLGRWLLLDKEQLKLLELRYVPSPQRTVTMDTIDTSKRTPVTFDTDVTVVTGDLQKYMD